MVYTCQTARVPDSRARILEAAFTLVREHGASAVTMAAIADAAGVSRQMVYVHFRSRAGLLTAMARDHDRRSGFAARVAEARDLPPVEAFERLLREWLAYVPEILPVARALEAAAITGEAGGSAWRDRMEDLHAVFGEAVARVAEAGRLAPGWTPEAATDWAWARCQPSGWDHVVTERGWNPEAYAERCARSVLAEIVRPAP
jgi:AcrR family transcriptional regulator